MALGRKSRQRDNFVRYLGVQQTRRAHVDAMPALDPRLLSLVRAHRDAAGATIVGGPQAII
jgi:hypothetical protein